MIEYINILICFLLGHTKSNKYRNAQIIDNGETWRFWRCARCKDLYIDFSVRDLVNGKSTT